MPAVEKSYFDMTDEERVADRARRDEIAARRSRDSLIDATRIDASQLEEAIVVALRQQGDGRAWTATYQVVSATQRALGYDSYRHPGLKFEGKLKRALEKMARDGRIVKISGRSASPRADGSRLKASGGSAVWALPEVAAHIESLHSTSVEKIERAKGDFDDRQAKLTEWASIHGIERLRFRHSYEVESDESANTVTMSLDDFEHLLIKAVQ